MSVVSAALRNLESFLKDHQISFYNGLLIFFTIAGEQIFKVSAYKCPCEQPAAFTYGVIFFVCPTVVLWILGVAVSNLTWHICHGCCDRDPKSKIGCRKSAGHLFVVAARASVVPTAWLFVTFLDGNYFSCMLATSPCDTTSKEFKSLQATSQNIGWIFLGVLVAVMFIVILCIRCCDPVSYYYYKYLSSYQELEQKHMEIFIQEKAEKHAKERIKEFADKNGQTKLDWDLISKSFDLQVFGEARKEQWANYEKLNEAKPESGEATLVIEVEPNNKQQQSGEVTSAV